MVVIVELKVVARVVFLFALWALVVVFAVVGVVVRV